MKKIKVLIASPCQGGYGGVEAFILAVAAALRRAARKATEVNVYMIRTCTALVLAAAACCLAGCQSDGGGSHDSASSAPMAVDRLLPLVEKHLSLT